MLDLQGRIVEPGQKGLKGSTVLRTRFPCGSPMSRRETVIVEPG
jgi:hypothetical protein